ncbi:MAG TPA: hypothetical protein VNN79_12640 [Actinomycetota bacterium]|nr:hypothetical protein [Actinomycetota bacterium]
MTRFALAALVLFAGLLGCSLSAVASPAVKVNVGANGVWLDGPATDFTKDVEGAATASLSLSPHISGVAQGFYGFTQQCIRYAAGARVTATDVDNKDFNIYLGLLYRGGSTDAVRPNEWAPDAGVGWKPNPKAWPHIIVGADAGYGLDSQKVVTTAALRYQF